MAGADRIVVNFGAETGEVEAGAARVSDSLGTVEGAIAEVEASGKDLSDGLIKAFLESQRAAGKSAEEIERVLVQSYGVPAEAAKRMAQISTDSLRDVDRAAGNTGDALEEVAETVEDSLGDVVDAQGEVADSAEEMGDAVEEAGERSKDSLDDISDKTGETGDALGTLGEIAQDALAGDFGDAAGTAIGALTGLSAAIPGLGAAAGVVFTEVGGALVESFQESAEQAEKRIAGMYQDMAESGNRYLSETFLQQEIQKQIEENYTRIAEVAKLTGLTEAEVARAMVTAGSDRNAVLEAANVAYQEQLRLASEASDATSYGGSSASYAAAQYAAVVSEFTKYNDEQSTAISKSDLFRDATSENLGAVIVGVKDLKDATESFKPIQLEVEKPDLEGVFGAIQADADARPIIFRTRLSNEHVL